VSSEPQVTVLLAVYNGERYLGEALDSLLAQSLSEFELLVVDDGSEDTTPRILADYAAGDGRIRVETRPRNEGLIAALNFGLEQARGALVARLDADDRACPERLALQVDYLARHPAVAVVGGAARLVGRGRSRIAHRPLEPDAVRVALERENALIHPSVMFRREAVLALGGYRDVALQAEDYDLWLRVSERHDLANLAETLIEYRFHDEQVSLTKRAQQVLTTLGVREAARLRRQGRPDPLAGAARIDRAMLDELGVSDDVVRDEMLRSFNGWIHLLLDLGLGQTAQEVGIELAGRPETQAAWGRAPAEASLAQARLARERGDHLRGGLLALRACLKSPSVLGDLARGARRRWSSETRADEAEP